MRRDHLDKQHQRQYNNDNNVLIFQRRIDLLSNTEWRLNVLCTMYATNVINTMYEILDSTDFERN